MTILQLKYFHSVYKCLNMTHAANQLYVSQPSVSTVIQELEEEFQTKLFLRTKPLKPTQAGERLAELTEPLLREFDNISYEMHQFSMQSTPLRIGISIIAMQFMQCLLENEMDFKEESLNFLGFYGCDYLLQCILDGKLDISIIATEDIRELQAFNFYNMASFDVQFYTNKNNSLCSFNTLSPQQIQKVPMTAFSEYPMSKVEFGEMMHSLLGNSYTENIQFFSTDLKSIEYAIENEQASCILLEGLFASNPLIKAIPIETNKKINFFAVWHKDHFLKPDELNFIQKMEKLIRKF